MRNRMYGGVRGRKTKVGEKLLRFPPTRIFNPRGRDSVENDLRLPKNETFQVKDGMKVMRL